MDYHAVLNLTPIQLTAILTEESTPPGFLKDYELAEMIENMRAYYGQSW
jgi:hypothetical protein